MDHTERKDLATQALSFTLAGNRTAALPLLDRIAVDSGPVQTYVVCCAFATAGAHAIRQLLAAEGLNPGGLVGVKPPADDDPDRLFARRFIVAFTNRDYEMAKALFMAAYTAPGNQFQQSLTALLDEAADIHTAVCQAPE
jgi:hypothetical protein